MVLTLCINISCGLLQELVAELDHGEAVQASIHERRVGLQF